MSTPSDAPGEPWCKAHEVRGQAGALLLVYVQPGASRTEIKGIFASDPPRLKISVAAPPTEGEANQAIARFLAATLEIAKSRVHLLSGETSRQKNVWIEAADPLLVSLRLMEAG